MKYILVIEAKQKNARRHIIKKSEDIESLEILAEEHVSNQYKKTIYTGNWQFVKEV